ncbi:DUF4347 domain-containing protein [Pseudanabaena sp. PCC 6802]|uniref:DUF7035 domain-containing protein n=1 Tax=Pseudanabaena sp. PCC 6802 TaxID=118173 RepID=UPI0003477BD3|nr:DUF4347 domain-containing protein [Pseudanabaena sp. PCC 6802]
MAAIDVSSNSLLLSTDLSLNLSILGTKDDSRTLDAKEIVLIDSGVADYPSLVAGVRSGVEVVVLDGMRDGVKQITEILSTRQDVASLHVVSHGSSGGMQLGNSWLSVETLDRYALDLQAWSEALAAGAELLIYGCEVAKGERGLALVARLSELTGASVAASTTKTGCALLGGDWALQVAPMPYQLAFLPAAMDEYVGIFADTNAPIPINLSLRNNSVDLSSGEGSIGLNLQVTDDSAGFNYGYVYFRSPSGQSIGVSLRDPNNLIGGTELAGTYTGASNLYSNSEVGTWTFESLQLSDDRGNQRTYTSSDLTALGINPSSLAFTVTNSNYDSQAPTLTNLSLTNNSMDLSSNEGSIGLNLQVTDNISGFSDGYAMFHNSSGEYLYMNLYDSNNLVNGTELAGTYSVEVFDNNYYGNKLGVWTFDFLRLTDDNGNSRTYNSTDLTALGIDPSTLNFTVTNSVDTQAPTLTNLSLRNNTVDVSSGDGSIGVNLQVTDNSSGFNFGSVTFRSPSGQIYDFSVYLSDPNNLTSGTELAGTYTGANNLSNSAETGIWTFESLQLFDDRFYSRTYNSSDLTALGIDPSTLAFTVSRGSTPTPDPDTTAPTLTNLSLRNNSVDLSSGEGSIGLNLQVADNISGFQSGSVYFRNSSGQSFQVNLSDPNNLASGTELAGTYTGAGQLSANSQPGVWTFDYLQLTDDNGNSRTYNSRNLTALGIDSSTLSFTVTNSDSQAPTPVSLSLNHTSVDVSSPDPSIRLNLQVTDDSSGFNQGYVTFRTPSGQSLQVNLKDPYNLVSGTELAGTYTGASNLNYYSELGTWTFSSLQLYDDRGNSHTYNSSDLTALGINSSTLNFTVTNSADRQAPTPVSLSLIGNTSVDLSSGEASIRLSLQVTDDSSGFQSGSVIFRSPSGQIYDFYVDLSDPNNLTSGTELAGTYTGARNLATNSQPGVWTFDSLRLYDDRGNNRTYNSSDLTALGIDTSKLAFTVTQGTNSALVLDANQSPTLTAIPEDSTNPVGNTVAQIIIDGSITDPDVPSGAAAEAIAVTSVDNTNGHWQYKAGSGSWANIDFSGANADKVLLLDGTDSIRFIPNANYNGTPTFTFKAWDKYVGTAGTYTYFSPTSPVLSAASDTASIAVTPINDAPVVATAIADQTAKKDAAFNFTIPANTFSDVDNATLTYTATLENGDPLPTWLSFNANTSTFSGTPLEGNGNINVKVTASDGTFSVSDVFALTVIPNISLAISGVNTAQLEGNSGTTNLTFTVTRSGDTTGATDVSYAVTGSGTNAANAADFGGTLPTDTVSFAANETTRTIVVPVSGDIVLEPNETFDVTLSNATGGASISTTVATGTIQNDDSATSLAISSANPEQIEGNSGTTAFSFLVMRTGDITGTTDVSYAVTGSGTNAATASDFVGNALPIGTISFAPGQSFKTIVVPVSGDVGFETNEDFTVTLSNPTGGAAITTATATSTIQNDDGASSLAISAVNAVQLESNSGTKAFTFSVTRSGNINGNTTFDYSVAGSGTNAANAADFGGVLPSGTVSFAAGESIKTVTVNVSGDTVGELDEDFTVNISNPSSGATITTASATGTIQNDDKTLAISATNAVQAEGNTGTKAFTFTVTRGGDTTGSTSVNYSVTGSGTNPANAADFGTVLPTGTVSFTAGQTSKVVTVNVKGDIARESDEDFTVTISNPTAGTTITTPTAKGTIRNDDNAPTFAIAATNANQAEGNSGNKAFTFTVTRTGDTTAANNVNWAVTGSGTNPSDATDFGGTLPTGTLSFAAGQTSKVVTVNVKGDTTAELDENFTVTLSNPTNGAIVATGDAAGTIKNDDLILGTAGGDTLSGTIGNDTISGLGGDDLLTGLTGNDSLNGGVGNDTLVGVDAIIGFGANEIDKLTGGTGSDRFILGDSTRTYYLGGGTTDYALITDFGVGDVIQTHNGDVLTIGGTLPTGVTGKALYLGSDLVAVVQGAVPTLASFVAV